jgi:hypothetical protein
VYLIRRTSGRKFQVEEATPSFHPPISEWPVNIHLHGHEAILLELLASKRWQTVSIDSPNFKSLQQELELQASRPARLGSTLQVGAVAETVTVTSGSAGSTDFSRESRRIEDQARKNSLALLNAPSQNVYNLQRRVAGVLPVRVDVPRAGKSYKFVRPLVLEEETKVTFQYKSK